MTWSRVRQEVRQMRFEELYEQRKRQALMMTEASECGVTEWTFAAQILYLR
jgi:hypothetical protein